MPIYPYSFQLPPLNVQDIPNDGAPGEFLGINGSGQLDWLTAGGGGSGDMLAANNLSELTNFATARTNIGLGTGNSPQFTGLQFSTDTFFIRGGAANLHLGAADAATPVAQTLSVQSVVAGTTNTAGAAFTIDGSQGTGTGAGGALIFRTAAAGSSGSTQNAFGTAMLITADKRVVPTGLTIDGSGLFEIFNDLASAQGRTFPARSASIGRLGICYRADAQIAWSPGNGSSVDGGNMGTADTILLRDGAANTLALRNGAAAQTFNVYGSYGSISDYKRLSISCDQTTGNATITNQAAGYTAGTVSINGVPVGLGKGNVSSNVAIGTNALNANSSGISNTFVGFGSGQATVATQYNTGVGESVLGNLNGGGRNTAVGAWALRQLTGGFENIAIGVTAGNLSTTGNFTSGDNNIFIGGNSKGVNAQNNQIVIGFEAIGLGLNSVVLGNDSITKTALKGNVGIGTTAPSTLLEIALTPTGSTLGQGIKLSRGSGYFSLANSTATTGFLASFTGKGTMAAAAYALLFEGISGSDADNSNPVVLFAAKNNSGSAGVGNSQTAYQFENYITPLLTIKGSGNVGIGTTSPSSKLHVEGNASPTITVANTSATGHSQLLFKNTVVTGDTDGIFLNASTQTGFGGAGSLNIKTTTGPIAFHTASVTNAISLSQAGVTTFSTGINVTPAYQSGFNFVGRSKILCGIDGTFLLTSNATTNFNRLNFGVQSDSFPALKISGTKLQVVLGSTDTTFTNIQGKLTTDTDFTATVVTPTGFLTLYDAQGNAYKVPCVPA